MRLTAPLLVAMIQLETRVGSHATQIYGAKAKLKCRRLKTQPVVAIGRVDKQRIRDDRMRVKTQFLPLTECVDPVSYTHLTLPTILLV